METKTAKTTTIINNIEYEVCPCCNKPISGSGKSLGGMAIFVVKSFVRKGAIVDFPGDWRRLCESQGFVTVHEHHAMIFKENRHPGLFCKDVVEITNRNSFFRKLHETKAAWKNFWKTLSKSDHKKWVADAEIFLKDAKELNPKLEITPNSILNCAMGGAFKASGENERDWNEHVRIDFEVVLCTRKV